jgi:hypothetical protein
MDKWTDASYAHSAVLRIPGDPWIFERIEGEFEFFDVDTIREEINPLTGVSSSESSS